MEYTRFGISDAPDAGDESFGSRSQGCCLDKVDFRGGGGRIEDPESRDNDVDFVVVQDFSHCADIAVINSYSTGHYSRHFRALCIH